MRIKISINILLLFLIAFSLCFIPTGHISADTADSPLRDEIILDTWDFQYGLDFEAGPDTGLWNSTDIPATWYMHTINMDPNLVVNPGFENGIEPWTPNPTNGLITIDTGSVHSGTSSLKMSNRTVSWHAPQQDITSVLDERGQGIYDASVWCKLGSGTGNFTLTLKITAGGQITYNKLATAGASADTFTKAAAVKSITWSGTLTSAIIYVDCTSTADLYIDDVSLVKQEPSVATSIQVTPSAVEMSPNENRTVTAVVYDQNNMAMSGLVINWSSDNPEIASVGSDGTITAVSTGTTAIRAAYGSLSATVIVEVKNNSNLITNPGFEDGIAYWVPNPVTGSIAIDTNKVHSGAASIKMTGRTAAWHAVEQEVTAMLSQKGQGIYGASAWAGLGSGSDIASVSLRIYASGQSTQYIELAGGTVGTELTHISGSKNVTWQGTLQKAYIYIATKTSTADLYVDDVNLNSVSDTTPVQNTTVALTGGGIAYAGEQYELTYGLSGVEDVSAQDITVSYDPGVFEVITGSDGKIAAQPLDANTTVVDTDTSTPGAIRLIIATTGEGNELNGQYIPVLKLFFNVKAAADASEIAVTRAELGNGSGAVHESALASITVKVTDRRALLAAIQAALALKESAVEGTENGQYPAGTRDRLKTAIEAAQTVYNNPEATTQQLVQAVDVLNTAAGFFRSLIITGSTGDFNNRTGYDIGDIGIVSANYGKKAGDENWGSIKKFDINGDGEIGVYELAFIARRLIGK